MTGFRSTHLLLGIFFVGVLCPHHMDHSFDQLLCPPLDCCFLHAPAVKQMKPSLGYCFYFIVVFSSLFCFASGDSSLVVSTNYGPVLGFHDGATNSSQWLGIRFAAPPVGKLRWAPPTAPAPWEQPVNASSYGQSCWQEASGTFGYDFVPSEDCLFINVARPRRPSSAPLPVMVWIYGGAYTGGSSTYYPLGNLSALANAIVVSFNYRVGVFGFYASQELQTLGRLNYGLLDQQFALSWVRDNAKAFGGDPDNVMIFGESAGGASVSLHLLMKDSWPLYHRAIAESPGPWQLPSLKKAFSLSDDLNEGLQCTSQNPSTQLECMKKLDAKTIFQYAVNASVANYFVPCVDEDQLIMEPTEMYNHSFANPNADVLLGSNRVEGNLFAELAKQVIGQLNVSKLEAELEAKLPDDVVKAIEAAYQSLVNDGEYFRVLADVLGKYFIDCPTAIMSDALSMRPTSARTYRYFFTHTTLHWRFSKLNATHTSELPYVFGSPLILNANLTQPEWQLSNSIMQYWANFLRTGNPNKGPWAISSHLSSAPLWPSYTTNGGGNTTMKLDIPLSTQPTPSFPICQLWDKLVFLTN